MPMRFKLDFTLKTSQERLNYLKENVDFDQLTKKDIETCTDYVLYGKDPDKDDTSMVDRKEIYIKTHYNSYNKIHYLQKHIHHENYDTLILVYHNLFQ